LEENVEIRRDKLPVLAPYASEDDIQAVTDVLKSGWWGKGPKVAEFEKKFAEMVGAKYAVAVTSASAGQDLVFKAMGIKDVDVISPTMSFMTTAAVPLWNNCTSTLVDVNEEDLNISVASVKKSLNKRTKALIVVNYAGVPADISGLRDVFDGFILEDCAHSCYTEGAGRESDAAVWSFQAVKTMPTGDGGMITTDDLDLYERLLPLTWLGISSTYSRFSGTEKTGTQKPGLAWDYDVRVLGYKAYMIDLTAALGLSQLAKLPANLAWRRHIQSEYNLKLSPNVRRPAWSETVQMYTARVEPQFRDPLMEYLSSKNIHTSVHYKPLHLHPINHGQISEFRVADSEWIKMVTLPCHNAMTQEDIDYVIYWINRFFEEKT
jgi:perosamine synthetase